jgi:hypothetical protein
MRRLAAEGMPKDRIAAHVTLIQEQIDKYLSGGTDRCRARG